MDDEVIRGATVIKDGQITWPPPAPKLTASRPAAPAQPTPKVAASREPTPGTDAIRTVVVFVLGGLALFGLGRVAPPSFMEHFTVFVLACFVGYQVIWNVKPALHTPLMSVTNAISGIIVIGAILQVAQSHFGIITLLAGVAILIASINIAGGFLVTQRMFRK
jgi:NAD(P) transhydrogenase subunit alpha